MQLGPWASRHLGYAAAVAVLLGLLGACSRSPPQPPRLAEAPVCALNWVNVADPGNGPSAEPRFFPFTSWRRDPASGSGFESARSPEGLGLGNGLIGLPDAVAFDEAWYRNAVAPRMIQVQAVRASRAGAIVPGEYEWVVQARDSAGTLSPVFGRESFRPRGQRLTPEAAAEALPQLMPVGVLTPQMFACAGGLSEDEAADTTLLYEITPPGQSSPAGISLIQDVLNGDNRFVPNAPGPLRGPAQPPSPRISGPGPQADRGVVRCAMIQQDDDATTRELHVIAVRNGDLLHSVISNFGAAVSDNGRGSPIERFNAVSPWRSVPQALGGGYGRITSAAVAPSGPRSVSVYFTAERNGRYRLFHTARLSQTGAWTRPEDVLALNGDAPGGTVYDFRVSANSCPPPGATSWTVANAEHLIALQGGPNPYFLPVIRRTPTAQQWSPGVTGRYSGLRNIRLYAGSFAEGQAENVRIPMVRISGRAFDRYRPPPP